MVIRENKSQLRNRFRKERVDRFTEDSWIHIISANEIQGAKNIATYLSYGYEPKTGDINTALLELGKNLYLPRLKENSDIEWVIWDGSQESLRMNGKIQEPTGAALFLPFILIGKETDWAKVVDLMIESWKKVRLGRSHYCTTVKLLMNLYHLNRTIKRLALQLPLKLLFGFKYLNYLSF